MVALHNPFSSDKHFPLYGERPFSWAASDMKNTTHVDFQAESIFSPLLDHFVPHLIDFYFNLQLYLSLQSILGGSLHNNTLS